MLLNLCAIERDYCRTRLGFCIWHINPFMYPRCISPFCIIYANLRYEGLMDIRKNKCQLIFTCYNVLHLLLVFNLKSLESGVFLAGKVFLSLTLKKSNSRYT